MKIAINCGQTLNGPGSGTIGFINESLETRNVGKILVELLKNSGNEVIDCTVDKADTQNAYLSECVRLSNQQDLDYFISIHFNAGGGKGTEIYTYKCNEYPEALNICKNISTLGFNNRGIKDGSNLYVIRKTKAKSMLVECCFVDTEDANKYKQLGAQKIAEAIYKAVVDNTNNIVSTPQQEDKPATGYTGGSIVDYLNSIGKDSSFSARKQYAQQYGIANYSGTAEQNETLCFLAKQGKLIKA